MNASQDAPALGLRRDLGRVHAYAAMIGILVGAGIFRVTGDAWALTGPSVILAHVVLAVPVLATSVAYAAFASTRLGEHPAGEYLHLRETFGRRGPAFVGAWLKIVSFVGALAYLAVALGDYLAALFGGTSSPAVPLVALGVFWAIHVAGARWFGRIQVAMLAVLGVSILVLVVPGLFAIRPENLQPFFTHGAGGFAAALPPVFFAYAGFEAVAHTAGEVRAPRRELPRVFVRGIATTTVVFLAMSFVAFGTLPGPALGASVAPMADVAAVYLPGWGTTVVTLGAVMALCTSLNTTMLVPSRIALALAGERLLPRLLARIDPRTGTPVIGLTLTYALAALLLSFGQLAVALNVAVLALVVLYLMHSVALLVLPWRRPDLEREIRGPSRRVRTAAAIASIVTLGALVVVSVHGDVQSMQAAALSARWRDGAITGTELLVGWSVVGAVLVLVRRRPDGLQ